MNTELEMTLRVWHAASPYREERVHYDKGLDRYTVRLEQDGRTVATGQARERDEAFARAAAQLAPDEPRGNRRTAIDPVTELAAARAWLEAEATAGHMTSDRARQALDALKGADLLHPYARNWLRRKADGCETTHARWARAVLTALETPRNRLAVVR